MSSIVKLNGIDRTEIFIDEGAVTEKMAMLATARCVIKVENQASLELATSSLKELRARYKEVEKQRKEIKAPVLELGRKIDAVSKVYCKELEEEGTRISKMIGEYDAELKRLAKIEADRIEAEKKAEADRVQKIEDDKRKAREEEERKQREKVEKAEREAREAQEKGDKEAKDKADAIAKAEQEKADELKKKQDAQAEADKLEKLKDEIQKPAEVAPVVPKVEGLKMRTTWHYEVTDIDLLYLNTPHLVKLEEDKPAIREAIKETKGIPGLKIWSESKAIV